VAYKNKLSQCIKLIWVESGIDIGMFPNIGKGKFIQVGNAAGAGPRMVLRSMEKRKQVAEKWRGTEGSLQTWNLPGVKGAPNRRTK